MKIQIKSWINASVLFECESDSTKLCVELAVNSRANLSRADLYGANLYGADLSGADLSGANLYGANLSRADLYGANLYGANLYGANLYGADLSGANLYGADLSGANLYGEKIDKIPIQISGLKWWINITKKHIQIGCQVYKAEEWFEFTDDKIKEMHSEALEWWKSNKEFIKLAWEHHCKD